MSFPLLSRPNEGLVRVFAFPPSGGHGIQVGHGPLLFIRPGILVPRGCQDGPAVVLLHVRGAVPVPEVSQKPLCRPL